MPFCGCCDGDEENKNGMFAVRYPRAREDTDLVLHWIFLRLSLTLLTLSCSHKDYAWNNQDEDEEESPRNGSRRHHRQASQDRELQIKLHSSFRAKKREKVYASPIDLNESFTTPNYPKTPEEVEFLDEALGDNFIFASLSTDERQLLIQAMQKESLPQDSIIIQEGDTESDFFYIVNQGQVNFVAKGEQVGSTSRGGSFGELALLYNSPRAATCIAATDVELWKVDQYTFRHLLARHAKEEEQEVCQVLANIPLFENFSPSCRSRLADALTVVKFNEGERIVTKGDVGEVFYIIQSGSVKVSDAGAGDSHFVDQILGEGDFFGERALLTGEKRAANVTAVTNVTTLCLSRAHFEKVVGFLDAIISRGMKKHFLAGIPLFAGSKFTDREMDDIADVTREVCFRKGEKIYEIGKPSPQEMWIIQSGRVLILSKDEEIHNFLTGDYFGDKSIKAEPGAVSTDTAVVEEDTTCWVLSKMDLEDVIGDMDRLSDEYIPYRRSSTLKNIRQKDIQKYRVLGKGAFGKVWLVRNKKDDHPFAMKQLEKDQLIRSQQVMSVMREKNIMQSLNHPFLLHMASSFQDQHRLYLVLQLIPGGELYSLVAGTNGLPRDHARFYAACILEAFGYIHARSICYRDLKTENVLIDAEGYCVVVDMGFAKIVVDKTYTLCGTPEYLAPEIIMSKGHDTAVDYWSYGVLVYELLTGVTPFFDRGISQNEMFKRIVMGKYNMASDLTDTEQDLVKKLLVRKQSARLGNLSRGYRDVKDHAWFEDMDFKKLVRKELPGPWIPEIKDPFDASNFEDYRLDEYDDDVRHRKLSREEQDLFRDF